MTTNNHLDPADVTIGTRIRDRRVSLGMSQRQLAAAVGIATDRLQQFEAGVLTISARQLYQLSLALGVSIVTFLEND